MPARNALKLAALQPAAASEHQQTAYRYAERGKARALLDLMAGGASRTDAVGDESVRLWLQDAAKLATWGSLLAAERGAQTPDAGRISYLEQKLPRRKLNYARPKPNWPQPARISTARSTARRQSPTSAK